MNLFIIGWNLPQEQVSVALAELRRMTEIYPQLEPDTIWHFSGGGSAFAASMHTAERAAMPRRYVWQNEDEVTFFDGFLIDRTASFPAHDAEALSSHWDQLPEALEGQFVVVRLTGNPPSMELLTDFLGLEQVYYWHQRNVWLVSNNVRLISRITRVSAWDPLGASLFLTINWVGADRTLRRDIRVIPGGHHWKWQPGDQEPDQEAYYPLSNLSRQRQRLRSLTGRDMNLLADELTANCRILDQSFGELECSLTGGRDSRLVAALLIAGRISAKYFTDGEPSSKDVQIATQIAKTCHVPHVMNVITKERVLTEWETVSWRLVQQNDGMVSLWQIQDVLDQSSNPDRLTVRLWGIGGEMARAELICPTLFVRPQSVETMQHYMARRCILDHGGLIRSEAIELARQYLNCFVREVIDAGFSVLDVPDVYFVSQRQRRWVGTNARKRTPVYDHFAPLCTRPFIEATFSMSALRRYSEPLHYGLIKLLVPELHGLPFEKSPWRSQRPFMHIARWIAGWPLRRVPFRIRSRFSRQGSKETIGAPAFDRPTWLEAKRSALRELCLDQSDSLLWSFVNRSVFERMMSDAVDPTERHHYAESLYTVATLFYYALT